MGNLMRPNSKDTADGIGHITDCFMRIASSKADTCRNMYLEDYGHSILSKQLNSLMAKKVACHMAIEFSTFDKIMVEILNERPPG